MDEKYIFGLVGIILGAILTIGKELYSEKRSRIKEAEFLAIRMVCILESFMEKCASVVGDDGLFHGQTDSDGYAHIQVPTPNLDIQIDDVNWKSLPPELMYEVLYFPNLIKDANSFIDSTFEYAASPPEFDEGFEERQYQYSILGLKSSELAGKLRIKYKIPKRNVSSWDIVKYMNTQKNKICELRTQRQAERNSINKPKMAKPENS